MNVFYCILLTKSHFLASLFSTSLDMNWEEPGMSELNYKKYEFLCNNPILQHLIGCPYLTSCAFQWTQRKTGRCITYRVYVLLIEVSIHIELRCHVLHTSSVCRALSLSPSVGVLESAEFNMWRWLPLNVLLPWINPNLPCYVSKNLASCKCLPVPYII